MVRIIRAAAPYLQEAFGSGRHRIIGFGHGRILAATVDHLVRESFPGLTIVSVLGGVPRRIAASPLDVVQALAGKIGAEAASLFVVGIGGVAEPGFICASGMILPEEIARARTARRRKSSATDERTAQAVLEAEHQRARHVA